MEIQPPSAVEHWVELQKLLENCELVNSGKSCLLHQRKKA